MTSSEIRKSPDVDLGRHIPTDEDYARLESDSRFIELRRRFRAFAFPATVAFLAWYLLYVLASAYARDFMDTKVVGNLNIAFFFGILQFVSTFLLAYLYSKFAARRLDPLADELNRDLGGRQ